MSDWWQSPNYDDLGLLSDPQNEAQLAKKMQCDALTDAAWEHACYFEEAIREIQLDLSAKQETPK